MKERNCVTGSRAEVDSGYPENGSRRRLIRGALGGGAAGLLAASPVALGQGKLAFRPAAFDARADSVLIGICGSDAARVRVDYADASDFGKPVSGPSVELARVRDFTATISVEGLRSGTRYFYRVVDPSNGAAVSEVCQFTTASLDATPFSFVFSGDVEDTYRPFWLFDVMVAQKPDFFLHLGDTVYADHPRREFSPSVSHYRRKHAAIRRDQHIQNFLAMVSTWQGRLQASLITHIRQRLATATKR